MTQLTVQVTAAGGQTVAAAFGEIDIASAPVLREAIDRLLSEGTDRLIVDLDGVEFMDSTGLNLLVGVARALGPSSLGVVACQPHIRRIFTISGVDELIRVSETMDEALEALPESPTPD